MFEKRGHSVTTAFDSAQVVRYAALRRFDAAIVDLGLEGRPGDAFAVIAEAGVPAVALTYGGKGCRADDTVLCDRYLAYPFTFGELEALVTETVWIKKSSKTEGTNE